MSILTILAVALAMVLVINSIFFFRVLPVRRKRQAISEFHHCFGITIHSLPLTGEEKKILELLVQKRLEELYQKEYNPEPFRTLSSNDPIIVQGKLDELHERAESSKKFSRACSVAACIGLYD